MKAANGFCVLFMLHLWFFDSGRTGKVLVWPMDFSHWINLEVILEELHLHGHEIIILVPSLSFLLDRIKIPFNVEILQLSVTKKLSQKSLILVSIHLFWSAKTFMVGLARKTNKSDQQFINIRQKSMCQCCHK